MRASRQIRTDLDAGQAAAGLVAGVQGGVVVLLATGRTDYLEAALDIGIGHLRSITG